MNKQQLEEALKYMEDAPWNRNRKEVTSNGAKASIAIYEAAQAHLEIMEHIKDE